MSLCQNDVSKRSVPRGVKVAIVAHFFEIFSRWLDLSSFFQIDLKLFKVEQQFPIYPTQKRYQKGTIFWQCAKSWPLSARCYRLRKEWVGKLSAAAVCFHSPLAPLLWGLENLTSAKRFYFGVVVKKNSPAKWHSKICESVRWGEKRHNQIWSRGDGFGAQKWPGRWWW